MPARTCSTAGVSDGRLGALPGPRDPLPAPVRALRSRPVPARVRARLEVRWQSRLG